MIAEPHLPQLNKFCVAPRHFLMVTKEFEKQTTPVTPLQLVAAYSILKQLGSREKHLAFYNSGRESGASQPHKQCVSCRVQGGSPTDEGRVHAAFSSFH